MNEKDQEDRLWENPKMVRKLVEHLPVGYTCYQALFSPSGKVADYIVEDMNSCFETMSGLHRKEILGKRLSELFACLKPEIMAQLAELGNEALRKKEKTAELYMSIFHHAYRVSVFFLDDSFMMATYEDVQLQAYRECHLRSIPRSLIEQSIGEADAEAQAAPRRTEAEEESRQTQKRRALESMLRAGPLAFFPKSCRFNAPDALLFRDSLTGIYDRFFAMEALRIYLDDGMLPFSVALGDVNGLQRVNDTEGYSAGDEMLIHIAAMLREQCRREDIVARWSEDGFILLLPHTSREGTEALLGRIQAKLDARYGKDTVTFGFATNDKIVRSETELLEEAEKWLYRKKLLTVKSYRNSILRLLLTTLQEKSAETQEHSDRMANYCRWIAEELHLPDELINDLVLLAMLHDIGKIGIRHEILNKPGPLTAGERHEMECHPEIGYKITRNIPELSQVSRYILSHHERWDGAGYPCGLHGREIPIASRIISVVDAYDVMISGRVYRAARSAEEALKELNRCSGTQFDPDIVKVFVKVISPGLRRPDRREERPAGRTERELGSPA